MSFGKIGRNTYRLKAHIKPFPLVPADLLENVKIKLVYFIVFLKNRDKPAGRYHLAVFNPTDQCLSAAEPAGNRIYFRLIIRNKFSIGNSVLIISQNLFFGHILFLH